MESCFSGSEILALSNLLNQGKENDDDFDDQQKVRTSTKKTTPVEKEKPKIIRKEEQCDSDEETEKKLEQELTKDNESEDWRKTPQWNLIYKQAVSPSDVYLQMSGKTQLTASCEEMVIVVELPGENAPNIDVKLKKDHLDLISPQFRLSIPLPHHVDPQKGSAKWDSYKDALILTLVMEREFDFVNF